MIFSLTKRLRWKNYIVLLVVSIEKYKILKYYTFSKQHWFLLLSEVSAK